MSDFMGGPVDQVEKYSPESRVIGQKNRLLRIVT